MLTDLYDFRINTLKRTRHIGVRPVRTLKFAQFSTVTLETVMTKRNLWMYVGAVLVIALFTFGCGGDDDGLSAEDMARISAAEAAAMMAQEDADAAAAAQAAAEAAAETRIDELEALLAASSSDEEIADLTAQIAMLVAEIAEEDPPAPDPGYQPSDPGGTLEGQEGRAAAARIDADDVFDKAATLGGLSQAPLGSDPALTVAVTGGSGLGTADDSADADAPAIAGFDGVNLMKMGPGAVTQTALVYSDAERSVRAFGDVYEYNAMSNGAAAEATTPAASRTHLTVRQIPDTGMTLADIDAKATLNHGLSTTGALMRTVTAGNTINGSYDGVAGQYVVEADTTLALSADGSVLTLTPTQNGNLAFRADDHETLMPDTDYLAFGVWAEVPDSPTTANPGRVRPFVHGNATAFSVGDVDGLAGSASYSGGAVGHYATRAKGDHMVTEGRFTASASLTANFDAADSSIVVIATGDPIEDGTTYEDATLLRANSTGAVLTGMITDFMTEDGTEMPGWLVNLNGGMMTPDMDDAFAAGVANTGAARRMAANAEVDVLGTTSGTTGSQAFTGSWEAWMFGNNTDTYPTGVAGNFQAATGSADPVPTEEARIDLFNDEGFAGVVGSFAGRN